MRSALGEDEVERFLERERSARVTRWVWIGMIGTALVVGIFL